MPEFTVASLNTRGLPFGRSRLADRYGAIGDCLESGPADVVGFQEVFTYRHLRWLGRRMPSYRHVSYRPSAAGPAGGLVTLSRLPLAGHRYRRLPGGITPRARLEAWLGLKGILATRLAGSGVWIVTTHLTTNIDGDWSSTNRFHPLHRGQLAALADTVAGLESAVVCGDFNIPGDTGLHRDFLARARLHDPFRGRCASTLQPRCLPPGVAPGRIDFILTTKRIEAVGTGLLFTGTRAMRGGPGYVSDHLGLTARLHVSTPAA